MIWYIIHSYHGRLIVVPQRQPRLFKPGAQSTFCAAPAGQAGERGLLRRGLLGVAAAFWRFGFDSCLKSILLFFLIVFVMLVELEGSCQ